MTDSYEGFARHIHACNNARLPDGRLPLRLRGVTLGWIDAGLLPALESHVSAGSGVTRGIEGGFELEDTGILEKLGGSLAANGHFRFRNEAFDILAEPHGPTLGRIDRGALPGFGLIASGVHVNGLVELPDGPHLWVGRRAADKLLDPNKLDHLVAGGIAAGYGPMQTLVKEGEEECSLPAALAAQAVKVAEITYRMQRPEGLRRDLLHCYDLTLPPGWIPTPNDGEVAGFHLLPLSQVFTAVRDTSDFKFNVNLVLIDLFLRRGLLDETRAEGRQLRAGLKGAL